MSELLVVIFLVISLFILLAIITLIFIHLYQIFEEPTIQRRMRKLRKPVQPWVTVLVYSHKNDPDVQPTVKALLRSNYHNFDIVIVEDASGDKVEALKKGYRKSEHGQVVVSLRAGAIVPPAFIKRAVATKGERQEVSLRIARSLTTNSLTEIVHSLNNSLWQRAHKVRVSGATNILLANKTLNVDFLITVFFIGIVSLSLVMNELIILWYSWLIFTSYLMATIWLNEEKVKVKMQLSFSAISALFLLPVASTAVRLSQFSTRN